jgi:hypothetical protein
MWMNSAEGVLSVKYEKESQYSKSRFHTGEMLYSITYKSRVPAPSSVSLMNQSIRLGPAQNLLHLSSSTNRLHPSTKSRSIAMNSRDRVDYSICGRRGRGMAMIVAWCSHDTPVTTPKYCQRSKRRHHNHKAGSMPVSWKHWSWAAGGRHGRSC